MVYLAKEKAKLYHTGNCCATRYCRPADEVEDLNEFLIPTFLEEKKLKMESERKVWNPLFNPAMETVDGGVHDKVMARYTSKKELHIYYLEAESDMSYSRLRQQWMFGWGGCPQH